MAEPLETVPFKVWALKVSIHCKGCMKKISKILKNTQGVAEVNIEPSLNKVTIKASVDADVLIARLAKYGKHAEVWPLPKPSPTKNDDNNKPEKEKIAEISKPKQSSEKSEKKPEAPMLSSDKQPDDIKKEAVAQKSSSDPVKKPENEPVDNKTSKEAPKSDDKKAEPEKPVATEKLESKTPVIDGNSKGKKSNEETTDKVPPNHSNFRAIDEGMAMPNMYSYPQHEYAEQQPPSYVMSYNMSQPTASQSYYAYPMQPEPQSFMYQQQQYPPPPQEYYYGSLEGNSSSGTRYRYNSYGDGMNVFNEEDPNSCSVM